MSNSSGKQLVEPIKYRVIFEGCQHSAIMSEKELHDLIEAQFNPATLQKENVYICPGCATGKRGFCHNSVLHPIAVATRLTPLDNRRLSL